MGCSISVIIPAFNAAETLHRCIAALAVSDTEPHEILIADDGSTDGSAQAAADSMAHARVIRIGDAPSGPAHARNTATHEATGDLIVFLDADVCVHPQTLSRLIAPLNADTSIVATFGSYDDTPDDTHAASLYGNLRHHSIHQRAPTEAATFWSGLGAVRREAFLAAGGFDTAFDRPSIEDVELGLRLRANGGRIVTVHSAQATHLKRWTVRGLWRTDVFARAIPWARLSVVHPELLKSLNAGPSQKFAALCVALVIGLIALAPVLVPRVGWQLPLAGVLIATAVWASINAGLLLLLLRRGGPWALLVGGFLHFVYYVYSSLIYVIGGFCFRRETR